MESADLYSLQGSPMHDIYSEKKSDNRRKKRFRKTLPVTFLVLFSASAGYGFSWWSERESDRATQDNVASFLKSVHSFEQEIVQNHPIFSDYLNESKVLTLRKYLLQHHLKAARDSGIPLMMDDNDIQNLVKSGILLSLEDEEMPYYFYNVRKELRYAAPETRKGLKLISERFMKNLNIEGETKVKFAISSAIRSAGKQKNLREINNNASLESSHSYGVSVDIFYDDFYVSFPEPNVETGFNKKLFDTLRPRMGFLTGDALARQLQSVLMESIIELQNDGKLFAILEKRQRVFHVTFLPGLEEN